MSWVVFTTCCFFFCIYAGESYLLSMKSSSLVKKKKMLHLSCRGWSSSDTEWPSNLCWSLSVPGLLNAAWLLLVPRLFPGRCLCKPLYCSCKWLVSAMGFYLGCLCSFWSGQVILYRMGEILLCFSGIHICYHMSILLVIPSIWGLSYGHLWVLFGWFWGQYLL